MTESTPKAPTTTRVADNLHDAVDAAAVDAAADATYDDSAAEAAADAAAEAATTATDDAVDPVPASLDAQIYAQLRAIARRHLAQWGAGVTTSPTTIVHEAWMRLAGNGGAYWGDRAHFLAVASRAMRQLPSPGRRMWSKAR